MPELVFELNRQERILTSLGRVSNVGNESLLNLNGILYFPLELLYEQTSNSYVFPFPSSEICIPPAS